MASRALGWSAVILALLLSGCGGADESRTTSSTVATATTSSTTVDGSTSGAPTTTTTSPPTTAATVEDNPVNGWNRSDPVVTSEIAVAGGIAVYEGLADSVVVPATDHEEAHRTGDPVLVAVDVSTGNELWRLEASLDGRVRGVLYSPTLIEDAGLLVRYVPAQGGLVSHDLLNGTEGWETVVLGGVTSLYECDGDVCVSGPRSRARFDADSGRQLDSVTTLDGRVLMNDEGIVIVPSDGWSLEDEPKEFVAYSDWGFAEAWTIPASDVAAIVGYEITPDMGWWFELADDKSVGVAFVGGAMPEDVEVDSEEYRQAFRNRPLGAIFGFDPKEAAVGTVFQWTEDGKRRIVFPESIAEAKIQLPPGLQSLK